jgi:hypothetical protein
MKPQALMDLQTNSIIRGIYSPVDNPVKEEEVVLLISDLESSPALTYFNSLLTQLRNDGEVPEKYIKYLYEGHLSHEASKLCNNNAAAYERFLLRSKDCYTEYLISHQHNKEISYFAQWQMGLLQEKLGFQWPEVEETLLRSSTLHPERGEAMRHVIQHYRNTNEYGIAYIYSSIAKDEYFGRLPEDIKWFGDASFYQWKVLNYHASICARIGNTREVEETITKLWKITQDHPEYFTHEQIQSIFKNYQANQ